MALSYVAPQIEDESSDSGFPDSEDSQRTCINRLANRWGVLAAVGVAALLVLGLCAPEASAARSAAVRGAAVGQLWGLQTNQFLSPLANVTDGNVCADDEELFVGLCYGKCSILAGPSYPKRTSAYSCCGNPCSLTKQKVASIFPLPCKGYDVGGMAEEPRGGCPHAPGACLVDEELFLGTCYKKCSLLTNAKYPYRVGSLTCCTSDSKLSCLNPFKDFTDVKFNVGGGNTAMDKVPHAPEIQLTEAPAPVMRTA